MEPLYGRPRYACPAHCRVSASQCVNWPLTQLDCSCLGTRCHSEHVPQSADTNIKASSSLCLQIPHLDINVGQRIGVVVRAHSTSGNYRVKAETRFGAPISGAAVLSVTSPTAKPGDPQALDAPLFNIPMEAGFDPSSLRAVNPLPADMHTATKMITVTGIQTIGEGGSVTYAPPLSLSASVLCKRCCLTRLGATG